MIQTIADLLNGQQIFVPFILLKITTLYKIKSISEIKIC